MTVYEKVPRVFYHDQETDLKSSSRRYSEVPMRNDDDLGNRGIDLLVGEFSRTFAVHD